MNEGTRLSKVLTHYGFIQNNETATVKIICPFHNDLRPSMICDLDKGEYYCFGCGKKGQAKDFVYHYDKCKNDMDALIKLSRIVNDKELSDIRERSYAKPESKYKQLLQAKNYYVSLNAVDWTANDLDPEICKVRDYMINRGFTTRLLNKAYARYTYNKDYPIVFPILDNKKFKGWVSRTTDKEVEQKRKYLYNRGFSRYTTLSGTYDYGAIVIICEGTMDMLKLKQLGIRNVVAILGWKITDYQISKLKSNGVKIVISALDNDECGTKGSIYLTKYFDVVRWRYLKGIKDVGEMNKQTFNKMYNKTNNIVKELYDHGNY